MFDLYIANKNYSSWSLRPWVLMTALEIPFNERLMPFEGGSGASHDTFLRFSPSGLVPCLVEVNGDVEEAVWDSLAIIEYLAESHAGVWPKARSTRAWARSACAEMHSGFTALRQACPMNCGVRVRLASLPEALKCDLSRLDALWQQGLERFDGPYLAGRAFGAVDAFFAPVAFRVQTFDLPLSDTSRDYVERLLQVPALQARYEQALAEPWREESHERDTLKNAMLLRDLRTG
ncbi:glutathione S-transferase family protein [Halomonas sp. 707D7]|uniref:glutathione S-transferase family protein n=2 Tax=unclassified Halomonas TaxID=2609666 RepID=UPI0020A1E2FA|nr:glutathione S-transferase family protein [Halomonas sp. 707D7]MCP1314036.1 glutathione S-transferase family protein [Halomonas sp. 707D7]